VVKGPVLAVQAYGTLRCALCDLDMLVRARTFAGPRTDERCRLIVSAVSLSAHLTPADSRPEYLFPKPDSKLSSSCTTTHACAIFPAAFLLIIFFRAANPRARRWITLSALSLWKTNLC